LGLRISLRISINVIDRLISMQMALGQSISLSLIALIAVDLITLRSPCPTLDRPNFPDRPHPITGFNGLAQ